VDSREPRLTDLMFSCRIQSKRVEHAFLARMVRKYTTAERPKFHANYRETPRNAPSGKVFKDMGFEETGHLDGVTLLAVSRDVIGPDDGIIQVIESGEAVPIQ